MGFDRLPAEAPPAPAPPADTAARPLRERRSVHRLGMPELSACGVSEGWLQKTCGERHWQALAALLGRPPTAWVDSQGRRVYAAFGALRWQAATTTTTTTTTSTTAEALEGARLTIATRCGAIDRAQAWSLHRLSTARGPVGRLALMSCFVSRHGGGNRSIGRVELGPAATLSPPAEIAAWRAESREGRSADADAEGLADAVFLPCPRSDFNGAGLLYFASYSAFVDRALWQWGRLPAAAAVRERALRFSGNLEPGEALRVRLLRDDAGPDGLRRLALLLHAAGDGRRLAACRLVVAPGPAVRT